MPTTLPFYKRSWFNWLILLLVATVLGWWFYQKSYRPFDIGFILSTEVTRPKIIATQLADGANMIENLEDNYKVKIPKRFSNNVANDTFNYYSDDNDCKLSFGTIDKSAASNLVEFFDKYDEQLIDMTVIKKEIVYLNNEKTRAIYTLETSETGLSKVYYEDLNNHYVQIYIYSGRKDKTCYNEINNLVVLRER